MRGLFYILTLVLLAMSSHQLSAEEVDPQTIYGKDQRKEPFEVEDSEILKLVPSVVALFKTENLTSSSNGKVKIAGSTLKQRFNTCSGVRFSDQSSASFCSGFLVSENKIVTAGHCVLTNESCQKEFAFVFDYIKPSAKTNIQEVLASNVYYCKKLVKRDYLKGDFSIIELDRNVEDRDSLVLSSKHYPKVGSSLLTIGFPLGLPMKIVEKGEVLSLGFSSFSFRSDLFHGNSGSPIFDLVSKEVVGILSSGEEDWESRFTVNNDSCSVYKKCEAKECAPEGASYIREVIPYL